MLRLFLIVLLIAFAQQPVTAATKDLDVPVSRCFKEAFRVGTGIPVGSSADVAANRNLIYALDMVVAGRGDPRKNTATALGYILHVANGRIYFEPADSLTPTQVETEAQVLRAWGVTNAKVVARAGSHAFVNLPERQARSVGGVRIVRCTSLGEGP